MKVLVLTNMYPTEQEPWAGAFVAEQVEDLRLLGLDIGVVRFDGRGDRKEYLRAGSRLRQIVTEEDFELVHAHYGLTGAVALAQRRVPVATTFHGSDTVIPWQRVVSFGVARLSAPLFVSDGGRRRLRLADAPVVPCGVNTERFRPRARTEVRAELGWDERAPHVLFPSRRGNPIKRADLFDATVAEARRAFPSLQAIALEGLSRDQAALVVAAADVTLMTSDWEGAPVIVKESLACQTPVVSVPVGDVPDVIAGLPGCQVCERDPVALGAAVVRAIDAGQSPLLRERAESYSRPQIARRILAVYERILSRPRQQR